MSVPDLLLSAGGVLGAILVGALTWRAPSWAVGVVVASVPLQAFAMIGTQETGLTWTQAWLWTFLAVGAVLAAAGELRIRLDLVNVSFSLVVVCYIVSRHAAVDVPAWRDEVYRWCVALAFLLVARGLPLGRRSPIPLVLATVIGSVWTGVTAISQVAGGIGPASFERAGRTRAYASFGEPNTYGAFAAGSMVVLVAILLFRRRSLSSWQVTAALIGGSFAGLGLTLSQSRGALAATSVVIGAMVLVKLNGRPSIPRSARLTAVVLATASAMFVVPRAVAEVSRWDDDVEVTTESWADQERLAHWRVATRMVVDSGGVGVGAGQFDARYRDITPTWRFRIPQGHAHNAYLQVAAETGLVGLAAYVALVTAVVGGVVRRIRRSGASLATVAAVMATAVFALHNLVDYLHVLNLPIILVAWWATALVESEGPATTS